MCGIAGLASFDGRPVDEHLLRRMTDALAHRGPDGEGFHVDGPVGLGHRRLAIIDLATGMQPMATRDEQMWITYNGEIYNFRELRSELASHGHRFETTSDTEVILAAYEQWGVSCLSRLRGMFAFGIWDARHRRLFLARDRVGIKPLVYAWDGRRLMFASELKAILEDPTVPRELDWAALRDYLMFHYVPGPRTIFQSIRKLPPACYMVFDGNGKEPAICRYWDLRFRSDVSRSEAEWLDGLRAHLEDAIGSHLVSDVPIGAFLSGGMDSSTVVSLMARASGNRVRTFSIGFDHADFDELPFARSVARRFGTDHYEFIVKPDALSAIPQLAWQFDEPFGDSSALPTYYVAKITREHVTVALSGDGGDENFAGYRRYAEAAALHERLDHGLGWLARSCFKYAAQLLSPGLRGQGYLELLGSSPIDRYFRTVTYQRPHSLGVLLTAEARGQMPPEVGPLSFRRLAEDATSADFISTLQYLDVHTYLPDDILTKVDRTSMLVSLEARVPLLDHVLMEYVATVPSELKLRNGAGKAILKSAMIGDLPGEIVTRPKMGFGVPLGAWFCGELQEYSRDVLDSPRARQRGIFQPRAIAALLKQHREGRRDRSAQLWALLCLEEWARRWLDR